MRAVLFKWQNLTREQRQPFEHVALEDKYRYERELNDIMKGLPRPNSSNLKL